MKNLFRKFLILLLAPIVAVTLFTACGDNDSGITDPDNGGDEELNIVETAQEDDRFSTLVSLIEDAGLVDALSTDELTVFAPTNEAFDALFEVVDPDDLTADDIIEILTYHVTEGSIPSSALQAQQDVEMLNEERTLVQSSAAGVLINGSSNVVVADINATNGVIHAVDEVLLPKEFRVAVNGPSLVEIAEEAGNFETLLGLVEEGGLTTTLRFLGPYTAFAPTDEAFDALFSQIDPGSLTEEQLAFILTYHVIIGGPILSTDLEAQQTVTAANEEALYITSDQENGVVVNGSANVGPADLEASNGVVHVVDEVLLPNAFLNAVQVAQKNYNFTTLVDLIIQADLADAVATSEITVFAPTNDAFDALFTEVDPQSLSDAQVSEILLYHTILGSTILSEDLAAEQTVESGSEEDLFITANAEGVVVNGSSNVVSADVEATNGVIHAVDTVLLPNAFLNTVEVAQKNYNFTTLVDLIVQANLADAVANNEITVFAPTNDAFDALFAEVDPQSLTADQVEEILLYHTIIGSTVLSTDLQAAQTVTSGSDESLYITADESVVVNASSTVVAADVESSNGVIHAIDSVLLPNAFLDVTGIVSKNYDLTTLVSLLADYELVTTLQGAGPYTVFAPTNEAFDDISAVLPTLTDDQIVETLLYHVLDSEVFSGDLAATQTVTMLNEQDVTITVSNGTVTIEGEGSTAVVTVADLDGTNGVVHIIDTVLIPALD